MLCKIKVYEMNQLQQTMKIYSDWYSLFQVFAHSNLLLNINSYKNIYLQPKIFNMGLKWNSYLTSLLRCGPVNSSTPIFGNISLTETMAIYLLLGNLINKWLQESLISLSSLYNYLQTKFISDVNFPSVSGKFVNPYFPHD